MSWTTPAILTLAAACTTESWIYAPRAESTVDVEAGVTEIAGIAVLEYDEEGLPPSEKMVSNALRMTVHNDGPQPWGLDFPAADPDDLVTFEEPNKLNVLGVYGRCRALTCRVEVPFVAFREPTVPTTIELTGDAIVTLETVVRRWDRIDEGAASLTFVFDDSVVAR